MTCIMCQGELRDKYDKFVADIDNHIVIINDVPAHICTQCGEISYSGEVFKEIEKIVAEAGKSTTEMYITNYGAVKEVA